MQHNYKPSVVAHIALQLKGYDANGSKYEIDKKPKYKALP